jgi:HSP20 family protein
MAEREEKRVTRWDPFRDLLEAWEPFRELRTSAWPLGRVWEELAGERSRALRPAIDVTETDDAYVVTAEIPGVKKDDLGVEIEEGILVIRGEKRTERDETKERGRRLERVYGAFSRSMSLPADADPEKINASFTDGVLRIEIPKKPGTKPRHVAIKG